MLRDKHRYIVSAFLKFTVFGVFIVFIVAELMIYHIILIDNHVHVSKEDFKVCNYVEYLRYQYGYTYR